MFFFLMWNVYKPKNKETSETINVLGFSESEDESEKKSAKSSKIKEKLNEDSEHPLITDLDYRDKEKKKTHKAELWFERDVFKNLIDEEDEDVDLDKMVENYKSRGAKIAGEESNGKLKKANEEAASGSESSSESDDSESDYDIEKEVRVTTNNAKKDGFEIVKTKSMFTKF